MDENQAFQILRNKCGNYILTVHRTESLPFVPYKIDLHANGTLYRTTSGTLAEGLSSILEKMGAETGKRD